MNKTTHNQTEQRKQRRFGGIGEIVFHLALVAAVIGVLVERAAYLSGGTIV
ncbi:MAG TPA: hypothetical protein VIN61_12890 [Gammaproteobacteria bacterium]